MRGGQRAVEWKEGQKDLPAHQPWWLARQQSWSSLLGGPYRHTHQLSQLSQSAVRAAAAVGDYDECEEGGVESVACRQTECERAARRGGRAASSANRGTLVAAAVHSSRAVDCRSPGTATALVCILESRQIAAAHCTRPGPQISGGIPTTPL